MKWSFLLAALIDCLAILVGLYVLLSGVVRGTTTSTAPLWLATLGGIGYVWLAYYLYQSGKTGFATKMLWVPAFLLLGYCLMILIFVTSKPGMK